MALPTYLIELQFGTSSWVDVTSVTNNVSIDKGISRQLDDYSAGTLSITFTNNDRTFDPTNTSSILWDSVHGYSLVQPGGKVRVSANGIRTFTGFIQSWDFTYDQAGFDANATLSALDEMFRVSNAVFDDSVEYKVQDTGNRIKNVLNVYGFDAAEYAGVSEGKTIIGADVHAAGDNVLSYLQNVARSEPADFFSNASGVMVMKDRSFTDYSWSNTFRTNLMVWPSTATSSIPTWNGQDSLGPYGVEGWTLGGRSSAVTSLFGGTPNWASVNSSFYRYEMWFWEINPQKYNPENSTNYTYSFSAYLKGSALRTEQGGVYGYIDLIDFAGSVLQHNYFSATTAVTATTWTQFAFTNTYSGPSTAAGISVRFYAGSTGTPNFFYGDGWQLERSTALSNYFDGTYNPYSSADSTVYSVGWSGTAYASYSGLITSVASTATSSTALTFADANSQGVSYGNGTALPFMELDLTYGAEQMYNKVQVVGKNVTASASDTAVIATYGLRSWAQTDNLTTSVTKPQSLANDFLAEFRLPEYRAQAITISLESLSSSNQNKVLALELRDVVKVYFQPSAQGSIIGKFYQILGITSNTDNERCHVTLKLGSLERLPIRLNSNYLAILNTSTLG